MSRGLATLYIIPASSLIAADHSPEYFGNGVGYRLPDSPTMTTLPSYLQHHTEGLVLRIIAAPRAKRSRIMGLHDGFPRVALAAPPSEGRANEVLIEYISTITNLPKQNIELLRGDTSKRKSILLRTSQRDVVSARVTAAVLAAGSKS